MNNGGKMRFLSIIGGRRWGKTTALMKAAKDHGCDVVTHSYMRASHLREEFPDFPFQIYPFELLLNKKEGKCADYLIDDLDLCFARFFSRCKGFAATSERHPLSLKSWEEIPWAFWTEKQELSYMTPTHEYTTQFEAKFLEEKNER